jgi:UrcA family protein
MTAATATATRTNKGRIAALAACVLAGSLGVAQAATPSDDVPTVVVRYGDLDLSTQEGAQTLYKRISSAARQVCPAGDPRVLARFDYSRNCRAAAIARAVSNVHSSRLAALHAERANHG